jgi:hypothetical protein
VCECALAVVIVLWSLARAGDLSRAASAFPQARLDVATAFGVSPDALASPIQRPALLMATAVVVAFAVAGVLLWRRRPQALTTIAFLMAGVELLCLVALFDLANRGADLGRVYKVWRSGYVAIVRHADRDLRFIAMALLIAIFLAAAAGVLTFARRSRASESAA